jgi:ABC-type multidrug transport system ATPase subunit
MAGLLPPTRGVVTMLGATNLRAVCHRVGYMAHAPLLYDELDAMENLRYFAGLYGVADERRCAAAIARVGLDPALARRVEQYSQGMRQRVSLARAVLHDPDVLLLDEPFSNVDITSAREMVRLLGAMRDGEPGGASGSRSHLFVAKTIFVVTHQPSLLEGVADEFVWMAEGRIVARTTGLAHGPGDVVSRPSEVRG